MRGQTTPTYDTFLNIFQIEIGAHFSFERFLPRMTRLQLLSDRKRRRMTVAAAVYPIAAVFHRGKAPKIHFKTRITLNSGRFSQLTANVSIGHNWATAIIEPNLRYKILIINANFARR